MFLTHIQGAQDILVVLAVKEGCLVSHQSGWKGAKIIWIKLLNLLFSQIVTEEPPVQAASLVMEGVEAHSWGVRLAVIENFIRL